jgi:hypothetical protein
VLTWAIAVIGTPLNGFVTADASLLRLDVITTKSNLLSPHMLLQQPLHSSLHGVPLASLTSWLISHPRRMLLAASKHKHVSLDSVILMLFLLMFTYSAVLCFLKPNASKEIQQ